MNLLRSFVLSIVLFSLIGGTMTADASDPSFWKWAQKPHMGWNSWDCFATTVTEEQTIAQADVMKNKLKKYGWKLITVDIQWYVPQATGFVYRLHVKMAKERPGRLYGYFRPKHQCALRIAQGCTAYLLTNYKYEKEQQ